MHVFKIDGLDHLSDKNIATFYGFKTSLIDGCTITAFAVQQVITTPHIGDSRPNHTWF
jgi:hypothetical protein